MLECNLAIGSAVCLSHGGDNASKPINVCGFHYWVDQE